MSRNQDFDDYEDAPAQKVWGAASILVGVAALGGFMALAWYAYHSGSATTDPTQAELVAADPTPYKEVPKDPGGWQAPHRDKTIYEVIDNNGKSTAPNVEHLTAAPEEPMEVTTSESGSSTWMNSKLRGESAEVPLTDAERQKGQTEEQAPAQKEEPKEETKAEPVPQLSATETPKAESVKSTSSATPKPDAAAIAAHAVKPETLVAQKAAAETQKPHEIAKPAPVKPITTKTSVKGGNSRVQLGAFRTEGEAAAHVKHLGSRVPGVLNGKSTTVERADLGEKGIYYRLFAMNFNREEAVAACGRIKIAHLDCMVK